MPGHRVHRYLDIKLFGKSYWRIHREMDKPWRYLGRSHRVLFHDPWSALAIARRWYPGDSNAELAALFHIHLDNLCSQNRLLKEQLLFFAKLQAKDKPAKRRKKRKRESSIDSLNRAGSVSEFEKEMFNFVLKAKAIRDLANELLK